MKKTIITSIATVAMISWMAFNTYQINKPQIGIINFAKVQQTAKAYVDAAQKQQKHDEQIQNIILKDKEFIKLQEEGQKLADNQKKMPVDEFKTKSVALQEKALKINEKYRTSFERNAFATQIALKALEKQIAEAVEATSKATGVQVILPVNTILYATEKVDLTEKFIKELDGRVQTVNYPDPITLQ